MLISISIDLTTMYLSWRKQIEQGSAQLQIYHALVVMFQIITRNQNTNVPPKNIDVHLFDYLAPISFSLFMPPTSFELGEGSLSCGAYWLHQLTAGLIELLLHPNVRPFTRILSGAEHFNSLRIGHCRLVGQVLVRKE